MFVVISSSSFRRSTFQSSDISHAIVSCYCGPRGISTWPAESKPNSKITKTKMIGVMLMASSIIDKKSPRRGRRAEHQSTDSRRQTRRKHASRTLERLDLSSCYFLKRSKIDISQRRDVSCAIRLAQHNQMTGSRHPFSRTASLI